MDDLIKRSDAIDALKVAYWNDDIQSAKNDPCIVDAMTDWAIRQVKDIPSAQQWIPVSERLPEVDVFVLVTLQHFNGEIDVIIAKVVKGYFPNELEWESDNGEWTWGVECGFAWMPLPEPYKESEDKE